MRINLILLIILFGIILFLLTNKENFEPVSSNQYGTWEQEYKSDTNTSNPTYYSQLDYKKVSEINCCLVQKTYLPSPNDMYGGNFKYMYTKKSGSECDLSKYNLNSNTQLLIEGENGWSNQFCLNKPNSNSKQLGSCRNINKECIDFVDKDFCNKYRMKWSSKTCHQPLDYTWIDPIKLELPNLPSGNGTFKMF